MSKTALPRNRIRASRGLVHVIWITLLMGGCWGRPGVTTPSRRLTEDATMFNHCSTSQGDWTVEMWTSAKAFQPREAIGILLELKRSEANDNVDRTLGGYDLHSANRQNKACRDDALGPLPVETQQPSSASLPCCCGLQIQQAQGRPFLSIVPY